MPSATGGDPLEEAVLDEEALGPLDVRRMLRERYDGATTSTETLTAALETLRAVAETLTPVSVHLRAAQVADCLYLDLARDDGQIVAISPEGWRVVSALHTGAVFTRGAGMRPLPIPERVAYADEESRGLLRGLLGLADDDPQWYRIYGWLVAALFADASRPVLWATGPQGSASPPGCAWSSRWSTR